MSDLKVTAAELNQRAGGHRDVAAAIAAAEAATDGATAAVTRTHGLVCSLTIAALSAAQMSRRNAAQAMETVSHDLAEKLNTAADQYTRTDLQGRQSLDGEMRTG
ncbi:type VII secretion target [Mycolicibacterium thermoresistibile]